MRFIAFNSDGHPALGVRLGSELVNLSAAGFPDTLDEALRMGDDLRPEAAKIIASSTRRIPLEGVNYLPTLQRPGKAIAVGLNYIDHAAEANVEVPKYPVLFSRYPSSWVAQGQSLMMSPLSGAFDFEGELVIVIGKRGRHISKKDALSHVAGYSVFNEGTMRDYQFKSSQWFMGKNFDRSGGFGPEMVSVDELPDGASGLRLRTRLNGVTMQDANTSNMIFDVQTLVSICSAPFELQPGDCIISGTPSGIGATRNPPVFMKPGDLCEVEIEGIGTLRNTVEMDSPEGALQPWKP